MLSSIRERLAESSDAFAAVFRNANLRRLELAWWASVTAYWSFIVALAVYAYGEGGAAAVGLVGVIRVLPAVVAVPFAATLGDRYRRDRVLGVVGLLRAVAVAAAAAAVYTGMPAGVVYALAALTAILWSIFRPTQSAVLPTLSRSPEELTAANVVLTTIESAGIFLGPAIGGLLLAAAGADLVFAASAAAFLWATLLVARIKTEVEPEQIGKMRGFAHAFAGFRTVLGDPQLRLIVGLYGAQTLVAGALNVLIVVSALELLDLGDAGVGFLNSAVGVGGLAGALVAFALVGRKRLASDFGVGLVLWGFPIALIGLFPEPPVALVLLALVGVGNTVVDVTAVTLLQRSVPDEVLTRVFGVVQSVFLGTLGLGAIVAPLAVEAIGIRPTLVATGALLPVLAALLWRRIRALEAKPVAARRLELLRALPMFAPLPPATLEGLAARLEPVGVPDGTEVMRQGEPGDRFYVVNAGELTVEVDGKVASRLGPGGYFGEIALLRDVPRTATVRADTDATLYALERNDFIGAVTGHPASAEAANAVIATRLASLRPGLASV